MSEVTRGARLRALREHLKISQEGLANLANVDRVIVSAWERNKNQMSGYGPRAALAQAFHVSVSQISAYIDGEIALQDIVRAIEEKKRHEGLDESGEVCLAPLDEPSPARAAAAAFAQANGLPAAAIEKVCRLPVVPLSAKEWFFRMEAAAFELREPEQVAETARKGSSRRNRVA